MREAGRLTRLAEEEATAESEARDEEERAHLLTSMGAAESGKMPPSVRSALRRLEEDQKRRSKRVRTDTLDRFLIDLTTFYRDALTLQLQTGSELVNQHIADSLRDHALNSTPEESLERIDTIARTRTRIRTSAAAGLAFEAMAVSLL